MIPSFVYCSFGSCLICLLICGFLKVSVHLIYPFAHLTRLKMIHERFLADTNAPLCRLQVRSHFDTLTAKEKAYGTILSNLIRRPQRTTSPVPVGMEVGSWLLRSHLNLLSLLKCCSRFLKRGIP